MKEAHQTALALAGVFIVLAAGALPAAMRHDAAKEFIRASDLYAAQRYEDALHAVPAGKRVAGMADFLAGKAAFHLERFADAESFFTRALAANPDSSRCTANLALSLLREGKSGEAAPHYRDIANNHADTDPDLAERAELALRAMGVKPAISSPAGRLTHEL